MKFRLKTTLCMVCLVSLLFGAGSCALISFSFQNALEREQAAARSAYALLVRTLQLVETVEVWSQPQDVVQVLQQLSAQGNKSWSALSLETEQVAVPGTSEHQLGLAVDIVDTQNQVLNRAQEDTAVQQWLMEHCWEYGFILRYPPDKEEKTGIIYEPWHYRYVGREYAQAIRQSGLCLEEFLQR